MMQIKGLAGAAGCVAGHAAVFRPSELCLERRAVSDSQAEIDAMEAARARYNETLRRLAGEPGLPRARRAPPSLRPTRSLPRTIISSTK